MSRAQYLFSFLVSRLVFLVAEVVVLERGERPSVFVRDANPVTLQGLAAPSG